MKRILIAILAIVLLSGCSASRLVKRAKRKDPSLFEQTIQIQKDTLIVEVQTVKEKIVTDTLVEIIQLDPITKKEVVIKYQILNDTIMIDCPDSEVVTVVETRTETITLEPTFWEKAQYGLYVVGAMIVVIGVIKLVT